VNLGIGGVEITSIFNEEGQLLRRSRQDRGREVVLIDNSDFYRRHRGRRFVDAYVDLPPLALNIPREKYVVEYEDASEDEVYDALIAPPLERLDRSYSLEEVRQSYRLRDRMRRVDLDAINFAFASWEVDADQYPKLERVADAIKRIIERNPDEVFMIEGHTDAVGSDIDNLSLSDRRAETVAIILSDTFRVPPENLVTQGYGEQFLKVETEAPSRENRRVAVRRVTPLLSRNQRQSLDR
jgi:outer membrane protein OmpA-like peptidoglycan-associated protein